MARPKDMDTVKLNTLLDGVFTQERMRLFDEGLAGFLASEAAEGFVPQHTFLARPQQLSADWFRRALEKRVLYEVRKKRADTEDAFVTAAIVHEVAHDLLTRLYDQFPHDVVPEGDALTHLQEVFLPFLDVIEDLRMREEVGEVEAERRLAEEAGWVRQAKIEDAMRRQQEEEDRRRELMGEGRVIPFPGKKK